MTDVATLLARFVDEWHAGRRPSVDALLTRAAPESRAELADEIAAFLDYAPPPTYDETTLGGLATTRDVMAAQEAFVTAARGYRSWPDVVAEWRRRAGLTPDSLAERVLAAAGLRGANVARAADYLYGFESGVHDPDSASPRLLNVLTRTLGIPEHELGSAAGALFRAEPGSESDTATQLTTLADALTTPVPGSQDPVDELFFG
jgi:hypothetical protein